MRFAAGSLGYTLEQDPKWNEDYDALLAASDPREETTALEK